VKLFELAPGAVSTDTVPPSASRDRTVVYGQTSHQFTDAIGHMTS